MARKKIDFKIDENGCFIVTSHAPTDSGHVQFFKNGRKEYIHRYIYEECFGELESKQVILHTCDNPTCVNPEHLKAGTQLENMQDMRDKGRARWAVYRGGENGMAKLNNEDVREIKARLADGETCEVLAVDFKVSYQTIYGIKSNRTWKHIVI